MEKFGTKWKIFGKHGQRWQKIEVFDTELKFLAKKQKTLAKKEEIAKTAGNGNFWHKIENFNQKWQEMDSFWQNMKLFGKKGEILAKNGT